MQNNIFEIPMVIFIIGTTASGKTKLSIEIAKHYNGEIVSCDSMQLYKEADIMTAKATKEQRSLVPHHMIDLIDVDHVGFTRNQYYHIALNQIKDIHSRGKIPIIIGGTHYYTETLLFDLNILDHGQQELTYEQQIRFEQIEILKKKFEQNINYHEILHQLDPVMAQRLHKDDNRKIETYLKVYISTGQLPSEFVKQNDIGKLRFSNSLIFQPKIKEKENMRIEMEKRIRQEMLTINGLQEILLILFKVTNLYNTIDLSQKDLKQEPRGIYY